MPRGCIKPKRFSTQRIPLKLEWIYKTKNTKWDNWSYKCKCRLEKSKIPKNDKYK